MSTQESYQCQKFPITIFAISKQFIFFAFFNKEICYPDGAVLGKMCVKQQYFAISFGSSIIEGFVNANICLAVSTFLILSFLTSGNFSKVIQPNKISLSKWENINPK